MMELDTNRRRFLELAGTGATLSLAGCAAPSPEGPIESSADSVDESTTVAVLLAIDSTALQETREDLVSKIQNGTINQTEAQQQLYATEADLLTDSADALETHVDEAETLTIEQEAPAVGWMQVSGSPTDLIGLLGIGSVRGLFAAETFEEATAQQQPAT